MEPNRLADPAVGGSWIALTAALVLAVLASACGTTTRVAAVKPSPTAVRATPSMTPATVTTHLSTDAFSIDLPSGWATCPQSQDVHLGVDLSAVANYCGESGFLVVSRQTGPPGVDANAAAARSAETSSTHLPQGCSTALEPATPDLGGVPAAAYDMNCPGATIPTTVAVYGGFFYYVTGEMDVSEYRRALASWRWSS